jgi:hypothetical protein
MIVTTLDPSLLGDIDMPYSNHPIPDRLMVGHGFKRLRARLTTIATPTAASSPCPARAYARRARRPAPTTRPPQPAHPTLRVVDVRYQAGSQFGSGFEQRSQSDASVREIPLAPQVVEVMRRRLPPGSNPAALLFTGLGGGPGQRSGPGVKKGTRTVLSRHNFHRTYHGALANSPTQPPRDSGRPPPASWGAPRPRTAHRRATRRPAQRPGPHRREGHHRLRPGRVRRRRSRRRRPNGPVDAPAAAQHPLLEAVDLHGAHETRHTFVTWLEDAGVPARVIDELMGHQAGRRASPRAA